MAKIFPLAHFRTNVLDCMRGGVKNSNFRIVIYFRLWLQLITNRSRCVHANGARDCARAQTVTSKDADEKMSSGSGVIESRTGSH